MGTFDSVKVKCPVCGKENWFQSKGGACHLRYFEFDDCPRDVFSDINRYAPEHCGCGTYYSVDTDKRKPMIVNRLDRNDILIKNGDIIDIHQTIDGCDIFVIISVKPLDIRYANDLFIRYQYDAEELLKRCMDTGEIEFEIIGNVSEMIRKLIDEKYV